jgi:hypothetical protein
LEPVICGVGDAFNIDVVVRVTAGFPAFVVLVNSASFDVDADTAPLLTGHIPTTDALGGAGDGDPDAVLYRVSLTLSAFPRPGFYDWQVVTVAPSGEPSVVTYARSDSSRLGSRLGGKTLPIMPEDRLGKVCQGRFIVHPSQVLHTHLHEVVVDLQVDLGM